MDLPLQRNKRDKSCFCSKTFIKWCWLWSFLIRKINIITNSLGYSLTTTNIHFLYVVGSQFITTTDFQFSFSFPSRCMCVFVCVCWGPGFLENGALFSLDFYQLSAESAESSISLPSFFHFKLCFIKGFVFNISSGHLVWSMHSCSRRVLFLSASQFRFAEMPALILVPLALILTATPSFFLFRFVDTDKFCREYVSASQVSLSWSYFLTHVISRTLYLNVKMSRGHSPPCLSPQRNTM